MFDCRDDVMPPLESSSTFPAPPFARCGSRGMPFGVRAISFGPSAHKRAGGPRRAVDVHPPRRWPPRGSRSLPGHELEVRADPCSPVSAGRAVFSTRPRPTNRRCPLPARRRPRPAGRRSLPHAGGRGAEIRCAACPSTRGLRTFPSRGPEGQFDIEERLTVVLPPRTPRAGRRVVSISSPDGGPPVFEVFLFSRALAPARTGARAVGRPRCRVEARRRRRVSGGVGVDRGT